MPEQLSLFEEDQTPPPGVSSRLPPRPTGKLTDRLFLAIFPDAPALDEIERRAGLCRQEHGLNGKPLARDRFHCTLQPLGDFTELPSDWVLDIREIAGGVRAAPFEVSFDRVESFHRKTGKLPLVMTGTSGVAAVQGLQRSVAAAFAGANAKLGGASGYTPHVTLLYDYRRVEAQQVEPIRWTVREFVLINSLLGQTRHIELGRWPLLG